MGAKVTKQAKQRIKSSKYKQKVTQFFEFYGRYTKSQLKQWADKNIAEDYNSVSYTTYDYPTYRKNKQEWFKGLEDAYNAKWRLTFVDFIDVQYVNNTEIVSCIYKLPYNQDGKEKEMYWEFDAIFDTNTGKWKKSIYKQYGSQDPLRYQDKVQQTTTSSKKSYTEPSYTPQSYPSSSNTTNTTTTNNYQKQYQEKQEQQRRQERIRQERAREDRDKQYRDRQERERQEREKQERERQDRQRREENDRIARERQQRQAAEREARYQEQQRQFRENMRRQEQQQAEYRRQQQIAAEQRQREYQQMIINNSRRF